MQTYIYTLLILSIVFSVIEFKTNKFIKEKKLRLNLLLTLFLHYLLYFCIHLTILFVFIPNYLPTWFVQLYILFQVLVLISWFLFDNKCIITLITNKLMNISNDFAFRDPMDIIKNKYRKIKSFKDNLDFNDKFHYFFITATISLSIYILLQKKV